MPSEVRPQMTEFRNCIDRLLQQDGINHLGRIDIAKLMKN